jgi:ADP-ribose pyrophosphatase YjhB (NUDIX family)
MHHIQKHILKKLSLSKKDRYADLKPRGVESNLFVYHLKALIREGYVISKDESYRLSAGGKLYADRVSFESFQERIQPKIVTILVIKNSDKYLLYRRRRQPFIGRIGFPYGKIHLEEHLDDAASRELNEKTGLETKLTHRGMVYITVHDETELVSHMLCHVFSGQNPSGELRTDTSIGECFWDKLESIPTKKLIPGVKEIAKLLKKKPSSKLFFAEYFLNTSEDD